MREFTDQTVVTKPGLMCGGQFGERIEVTESGFSIVGLDDGGLVSFAPGDVALLEVVPAEWFENLAPWIPVAQEVQDFVDTCVLE